MRRLFLLALLVLAGTASAQNYSDCQTGQNFVPVAFAKETITVSSTAIGLTKATYNPAASGRTALVAFMTVAADNIRVWFDGSIPTATVGHLITSGSGLMICSADLPKFLAIRQTTDATVSVTYYALPN